MEFKGTHNDVSSSVLDAAMWWKMGKMVMETDLDLNGKRLLNYKPQIKNSHFWAIWQRKRNNQN